MYPAHDHCDPSCRVMTQDDRIDLIVEHEAATIEVGRSRANELDAVPRVVAGTAINEIGLG